VPQQVVAGADPKRPEDVPASGIRDKVQRIIGGVGSRVSLISDFCTEGQPYWLTPNLSNPMADIEVIVCVLPGEVEVLPVGTYEWTPLLGSGC